MFIFYILHQTTTRRMLSKVNICCLSFISYIKPQLVTVVLIKSISCLSFISYIKPQLTLLKIQGAKVVYLLYPTSNHNCWTTRTARSMVVYLLYPTSNHNNDFIHSCRFLLFIFYILHQTTTYSGEGAGNQLIAFTPTDRKRRVGICLWGKDIKKSLTVWAP